MRAQQRRERGDRVAQVLLARRERRHRRVERGDEAGELGLARRRAPGTPARCRSPTLHRSCGWLPEQCLVDDRRGLERAGRVFERLVQRLARRSARARSGSWVGVLGGGRRPFERGAEPLHQRLQVGAGIGVKRRQHAVELHRPRGVGRRQRRAARAGSARSACRAAGRRRSCPRGRSAAGSARRVRVDRQPVVVDLHRHDRRAGRCRGTCCTEVTSPTSTPAIRTGEGMCSSVCVVNTALSTNGEAVNGDRAAEHQVARPRRSRRAAMMPAAKFEIPRPVAPHVSLFVVVSGLQLRTLPGGFADRRWPRPSTARCRPRTRPSARASRCSGTG